MFLWKESINSDGQQFHQYQQNKQSPLTSHNWAYKKDHPGNPDPCLTQAQKCGGV